MVCRLVMFTYTMSRVIVIIFSTFLAPFLSHLTSDHKLAAKVSAVAMLLFQTARPSLSLGSCARLLVAWLLLSACGHHPLRLFQLSENVEAGQH